MKRVIDTFALAATAMIAATSYAGTVAWWHFDEEAPGTTATSGVVKESISGATATSYTITSNKVEQIDSYRPVFWRTFPGLAVYDPVVGTTNENHSAAKFKIASVGDAKGGRAYYGGALKVDGGDSLYAGCKSAITVEAFVCTTGGVYNLFAPIVGCVTNGNFTSEPWALYMLDDGTVVVRHNGTAYYQDDNKGKTTINDGFWHHVAWTWNGSTIRVYVDYKLDKKGNSGGDRTYSRSGTFSYPAGKCATWIGGYATHDRSNGGRKFPGIVDEVRISNVALTPDQFLRMQPLDMDPDEIVRVSFTPDEYGVPLKNSMNLADALGPNLQKAEFLTVSGAGSSAYDTETKAGAIMAGRTETDFWVEDVASFYQETNAAGKANYIRLPGISTALRGSDGTNSSYTVEMFYKTRTAMGKSGRQSIMRFGAQPWWDVRLEGGDSKLHYIDNKADGTSDPFNRAESTADAADCRWHHVAVVVDGSAQKISYYFDYVLDKSRTGKLPDIGTGNSIFFAAKENGSDQWYDGWLDDIRVTRRALEPNEFLTTRPVGSGDISLLALFEQNYDFTCASNANLSVTGVGEARIDDNVPTFVKESRGTLLLDGTNGTERAANEYSVHLNRSRVVFPSSPFWALDSYTVEFWARFDGVIDKNGTVAVDPDILDSHVPIMRLARGNSNSYDWYVYRGREKEHNNCIQMAIGSQYPVWTLPSNKLLIDGRWHHYAFTFEPVNDGANTLVKLFYDYKNVKYGNPSREGFTLNARLPKRVDGRLMLGEGSNNHPNIVGEFDAVRVSKGVLTPDKFLGRVRMGTVIVIR